MCPPLNDAIYTFPCHKKTKMLFSFWQVKLWVMIIKGWISQDFYFLFFIADQWKSLTNEWLRWCLPLWNERLIASLRKVFSCLLSLFPPLSPLCECVCVCVWKRNRFKTHNNRNTLFWHSINIIVLPQLKSEGKRSRPTAACFIRKQKKTTKLLPIYQMVAKIHTWQWTWHKNITCCTVWCNSQATLNLWQSVLEVFGFTCFFRSGRCTALHDRISCDFTQKYACRPKPGVGNVFFDDGGFSQMLHWQSCTDRTAPVTEKQWLERSPT